MSHDIRAFAFNRIITTNITSITKTLEIDLQRNNELEVRTALNSLLSAKTILLQLINEFLLKVSVEKAEDFLKQVLNILNTIDRFVAKIEFFFQRKTTSCNIEENMDREQAWFSFREQNRTQNLPNHNDYENRQMGFLEERSESRSDDIGLNGRIGANVGAGITIAGLEFGVGAKANVGAEIGATYNRSTTSKNSRQPIPMAAPPNWESLKLKK